MPDCFHKLLNSQEVANRWMNETLSGIRDMLEMFIDLLVTRLKYRPIPAILLRVLAVIFDPDCSYMQKVKTRQSDEETIVQ